MADEITLSAVRKYLSDNKPDADVVEYLAGLNPLAELTIDSAGALVDGTPALRDYRDARVQAAVERWKDRNLRDEVEKRVKELHPDETPEQKRIRELEDANATRDADAKRREQVDRAREGLLKIDGIDPGARALAVRLAQDTDEGTDTAVREVSAVFKAQERRVKEGLAQVHGLETDPAAGGERNGNNSLIETLSIGDALRGGGQSEEVDLQKVMADADAEIRAAR